MSRQPIIALLLLAALPSFGYEPEGIKGGKVREYPFHQHPLLEVGVSLGTPTVLGNLIVGYWKGGEIPLLVRFSGMWWGRIQGLQWEIGFGVDREGDFRQSITGGGLFINDRTGDWSGFAAFYTMNWYGFYVQPGITFGRGSLRSRSPQALFQFGYSFLFKL